MLKSITEFKNRNEIGAHQNMCERNCLIISSKITINEILQVNTINETFNFLFVSTDNKTWTPLSVPYLFSSK